LKLSEHHRPKEEERRRRRRRRRKRKQNDVKVKKLQVKIRNKPQLPSCGLAPRGELSQR